MKKIIFIFVLLSLSLISGCTKEKKLSIKLCGYSHSIPGKTQKMEFDLWSIGMYVEKNEKKNVTFETNLGTIDGEYLYSWIRMYEYFVTKVYKTSNNDEFMITEEGNICYYNWGSDYLISTKQITKEECVEIANTFLSKFVNVNDYSQNIQPYNSIDGYEISYYKYINGIKSADQARIIIDKNGNLYSFYSTLLGMIPKNTSINFDIDEIHDLVVERLDKEYKDIKLKFDEIRYDEFNYTLTLIDKNIYAIVCTVNVKCVDVFENNTESTIGEKLQFIIE